MKNKNQDTGNFFVPLFPERFFEWLENRCNFVRRFIILQKKDIFLFSAVNFFVSKRMNLWRTLKKAKQSFHSGGKT
jgi:hypothetical protein